MNRAHTVWLDQLSNTNATALPASAHAVALPHFELGASMPKTKRDLFLAVMRFAWNQKGRLVLLYVLWKLLRKLNELGTSRQDPPFTPLLPGSTVHSTLFPAFLRSESTGLWLFTRAWRVRPSDEKGRVFLLHAYREHIGRYESLISDFNSAGYSVFGMDQQGHGQSGGARGYVESFRHYLVDTLAWMTHTMEREGTTRRNEDGTPNSEPVPVFIYGGTMGALLALQIVRTLEWRRQAEEGDAEAAAAEEQKHRSADAAGAAKAAAAVAASIAEEEQWVETNPPAASSSSSHAADAHCPPTAPTWRISGLILSSPVLIPSRSASPLLQALASALADVVPRFGFITLLDVNQLSRVRQARERFLADPLIYRGYMPVRFGHELLEAMSDTRSGLGEITVPVLVLQGDADTIVAPAGSQYAIEHLASADKTIQVYPGGMHDLYADTCREEMAKNVVEWLNRQTFQALPTATESTAASAAATSSSTSSGGNKTSSKQQRRR
jgi:alpha-beta hydrolase superfamily lysophospholipase